MKEIEIKHLEIGKKLGKRVYHKSGELLHKAEEELTLEHLALMEECGIERVIFLDADEDELNLKNTTQKKTVTLDKLKPGDTVPVALYDNNNALIAEEGTILGDDFMERLRSASIKELHYRRDAQELGHFQYNKYLSLLESDMFASLGSVTDLEHPLERVDIRSAGVLHPLDTVETGRQR